MTNSTLDEPYWWLAAGWTMLHFIWLGAGIGLLAAVARRLTLRAPPNVRYLVALGWLAVTSAVPCVLFAHALGAAGRQAPTAQLTSDMEPGALNGSEAAGTSPGSEKRPDARAEPTGTLAFVAPLWGHARNVSWAACRWLPWLWVVGTPLTLLGLAFGVGGAERMRRASRVLLEGETFEVCRRLRSSLRISRCVGVAVCRRACAPLLVGILRPLILLPPALLAECTPEQIEMVLLHELAHVRRWDNLVNVAQRIVEATLFFHPSVWWQSNWVRLEREHCCDAMVLSHLKRPQAYAETLAALALSRAAPQRVAAAMADRHVIIRIRHILNLEDPSMKISKTLLTLLAAAFVAVVYCVVHSGAAADDEPQPNAVNPHARLVRMLQDHRRPYGPEQATGAPDTADAGDRETAWAPQKQENRAEWLELTYAQPFEAVALMVYETLNPDPLLALDVYDDSGAVSPLWTGAPKCIDREKNISFVQFPRTVKTNRIRIHFEPKSATDSWFQIDAVGLLDVTGATHWATSATASSSYADAAGSGDSNHWNVQQTTPWSIAGSGQLYMPLGPFSNVVEFDFERVSRVEKQLQELRLEVEGMKRGRQSEPEHPK